MTKNKKKVFLMVLDGVGYADETKKHGNAIEKANLPNLKGVWKNNPTIFLKASGEAVGMPSDDDMGNSEVGHNVLGSGRIFAQGAKLVAKSLENGDMFQNEVWKKLINNCVNDKTLHFVGLLSDGNVHSNIKHLKKMIEKASENVKKIRLHILLDGRDVPDHTAIKYINEIEDFCKSLDSDIKIASGGGRMKITMDRYEADWKMVENGWKTHVLGEGRCFQNAVDAVNTFYKKDENINDQYLPEFVIVDENKNPIGKIQNYDSVIFFNFRGDRAIEISRAFGEKDFDKFDRRGIDSVLFAGMMVYDGDENIPNMYLVEPPKINNVLSEILIKNNIKQYAISETQKFGHITYFWNGNKSGYINEEMEKYVEIPSDNVLFDTKPEMKVFEITAELKEVLKDGQYQFVRVNFPNGDMVGHTGNIDATIKSLEALDKCIGELIEMAKQNDFITLITADHGNAEEMYKLDKNGEIVKDENGKAILKTSHTLNKVHFSMVDPSSELLLDEQFTGYGLANVSATVLDIFGIDIPNDYEKSFLKR